MRGGGGREKDATRNNLEQESWQWDVLTEGVYILNFTRPPPKKDSSCRQGIRKDLHVFPSNTVFSEPLPAAGHRLGQHSQEGAEKSGAADIARIPHRASSRVDYLEHPVIPRLLGFQISRHGNGNASLEGTEPLSILTVSRAWLSSVGRPSSSSQGSAIQPQQKQYSPMGRGIPST